MSKGTVQSFPIVTLLALSLLCVATRAATATTGATLIHVGGPKTAPAAVDDVPTVEDGNLARVSSAQAFGSPAVLGTTVSELNDGRYGDRWCWTGASSPVSGQTFAGLYFTGGEVTIQHVALGRDSASAGSHSRDRMPSEYRVEVTLDLFDPHDEQAVSAASWQEIARLDNHAHRLVPQHRRLYRLDAPVTLRALRIIVGSGHAIDELEVGDRLPPFPPPTVSQIYTQILEDQLVVNDACAWPNLTLFPDGRIVATIHSSPSHGQMPGDVECWASDDGGRTWALRGVPGKAEPKTVRMNVAAGLAHNGDFVVLCGGWGYAPTFRDQQLPVWVCRSTDEGRTWARQKHAVTIPEDGSWGTPFGNIVRLPDQRLAINFYGENVQTGYDDIAYIIYSDDDGRTWGRQWSLLDRRVNETALLRLSSDRWLAAARANYTGDYLEYYVSQDEGVTWKPQGRLTGNDRHPGHFVRLASGRIVLSFGMRDQPGVGIRISDDNGATWRAATTLLPFPASSRDCGYPATVELADSTLVTAYYADARGPREEYHMGVVRWRLYLPTPTDVDGVPTFVEGNLAMAPDAVAFGTPDDYEQTIDEINDGAYGDPKSYISGAAGTYTGLRYAGIRWVGGPRTFDHVTIGRDNTGKVNDRASVKYVLEYTAAEFELPDAPVAADKVINSLTWRRVGGTLDGHLTDGIPNRALRRRYKLSFPVAATAIRMRISKGDGVDELEIYRGAPPR